MTRREGLLLAAPGQCPEVLFPPLPEQVDVVTHSPPRVPTTHVCEAARACATRTAVVREVAKNFIGKNGF